MDIRTADAGRRRSVHGQRKCELARLTGRRASDFELVRFFGSARIAGVTASTADGSGPRRQNNREGSGDEDSSSQRCSAVRQAGSGKEENRKS